jgi:hypothetical protein
MEASLPLTTNEDFDMVNEEDTSVVLANAQGPTVSSNVTDTDDEPGRVAVNASTTVAQQVHTHWNKQPADSTGDDTTNR